MASLSIAAPRYPHPLSAVTAARSHLPVPARQVGDRGAGDVLAQTQESEEPPPSFPCGGLTEGDSQ